MAAVARALRPSCRHTPHYAASARNLASPSVRTLTPAHGRCGHATGSIAGTRDLELRSLLQRWDMRPTVASDAGWVASRWILIGDDAALHAAHVARSEAPVESIHETSLRFAFGGSDEDSRAERDLTKLFAELDAPGVLRVGILTELPVGGVQAPESRAERPVDDFRPHGTLVHLLYLFCNLCVGAARQPKVATP